MVNFVATTRRWYDRGNPRDAGESDARQIVMAFLYSHFLTEYTKEYLSRKLSIILTGQNGNQSRVEKSTLLFLYPNHRAAGIAAHFQQQTELYKNHVERKTNEKSHDYPHGARYRGAGGKEIRALKAARRKLQARQRG